MRRLYMSMEISNTYWHLAFCAGNRKRRFQKLHSDRFRELPELIARAKERLGLEPDAPVLACHEAGLQGFWIHRMLETYGYESLVVDPASIEVSRRQKHVKTDRVDVKKLMNMLLRHAGGETGMWKLVHVPSPREEDRRRIHRELKRLKKERTQHNNRIIGLLKLHGPIRVRINRGFRERLPKLKDWNGQELPRHARAEIEREYQRWVMVQDEILSLDQLKREMVRENDPAMRGVRRLKRLSGIGMGGGWDFTCEMFSWRKFKNRKEVGAFLGLTGTPYDSGASQRDQGISKAGDGSLRALACELAWQWVRWQPTSSLTMWFHKKTAGGGKRIRRVAITAVARKLVIALWHFYETGIPPKGARLSPE